jgi:hypothetical protein
MTLADPTTVGANVTVIGYARAYSTCGTSSLESQVVKVRRGMLKSPVSGASGDRSGAGVGVDQASVNADRGRVWTESTHLDP